MATEYVSLEAVKNAIHRDLDMQGLYLPIEFIELLDDIPTADVRPVAEISNAVDEVLDFLNDNANCMPYHIYSALFDLVSGICHNCGADMREVKVDG